MEYTNRYNVFNNIHKGLRGLLFTIQLKIQQTDFSSEESRPVISELKTALLYYDEHAEHEDQFILVHILQHAPHLLKELENDHIVDHDLSAELRRYISQYDQAVTPHEKELAGKEIFYAFNEFIAFNLYHMNKEENELMIVLWKHFTDAEIMAMEGKILAAMDPQVLMEESRLMMRSLNNRELLQWFEGLRHGAPEPVYQLYKHMAEEELPADRFSLLV